MIEKLKCKYCGSVRKNNNSFRNHERLCKDNPNRDTSNIINKSNNPHMTRTKCIYCSKSIGLPNMKRHWKTCYLNPVNIRFCPVCDKIIKSRDGVTCSRACSNTYFRSGKNSGNWKEEAYRSTCFLYHKKECIICGEDKIVAVHHFDEDKKNNKPENLIPLCPTHHLYCHSKYKGEVIQKILDYIKDFKKTLKRL